MIFTELQGKDISISFDGTTREGESIAVTARYVTSDFLIRERLINVACELKSVDSSQLFQVLRQTLFHNLNLPHSALIGIMRDGVNVNGVATKQLQQFYNESVDVTCFAHTLNNAGDKLSTSVLQAFTSTWITMMSSDAVRAIWRAKVGSSLPRVGSTRWWSRQALLSYLLLYFGFIPDFLKDIQKRQLCKTTVRDLLAVLDDPLKRKTLQAELAIAVDGLDVFARATTVLEGDGPLALTTYDEIRSLEAAITTATYPNLNLVITSLKLTEAEASLLRTQAKATVQPCFDYFRKKFIGTPTKKAQFQASVDVFKATRLFHPRNAPILLPKSFSDLKSLPFITKDMLLTMEKELAKYVQLATDYPDPDMLAWWRRFGHEIPTWASATKKALLLQPTSASCERVFSHLNGMLSIRQKSSCMDLVEASLMLRVNFED